MGGSKDKLLLYMIAKGGTGNKETYLYVAEVGYCV